MTSLAFPSASYGRNAESPEAGVDPYQVLFQSVDFPAAARKALEQLATSVQWAGGGPVEKYVDCYALWPVAQPPGGVLVARLMDAGKDRLGRPHAMRVDAAYVASAEPTTDPMQLASLLTAAAWPGEAWNGPPEGIHLGAGSPDPAVAAALEQAGSQGRGLPRAFVACHSQFRAHGFDLVFDPSSPAGRPSAKHAKAEMRLAGDAAAERLAEGPALFRRLPVAWIIAMLATLGGAALIGWWGLDRYERLEGDYSKLQGQLEDLKLNLDREISAHRETTARLVQSRQDLQAQGRELAQLSESLQELKGVLGNFKIESAADLRARLQLADDARLKSPAFGDLETVHRVDNAVNNCYEEIDKTLRTLQAAKKELEQHRNGKTTEPGKSMPPAGLRGGMKDEG